VAWGPGITGIDEKTTTDELMMLPVSVSKDHHIRSMMKKTQLQSFRQCVRIHDMMEEKFAPTQLHHLQVPEFKSRIVGISPYDGHGRNRFQVQNQTRKSHVARVQDMVDPLKQVENLRVQMPVGVGDKADFHSM